MIQLKDARDQGAVTAGAPARPSAAGAGRLVLIAVAASDRVARRPLVEPIPRLLRDS